MRDYRKLPGIELFGDDPYLDWYDGGYERGTDFYWYVYKSKKLSIEDRKKLKSLGWRLERHPRTNKECWFIWEPKG